MSCSLTTCFRSGIETTRLFVDSVTASRSNLPRLDDDGSATVGSSTETERQTFGAWDGAPSGSAGVDFL